MERLRQQLEGGLWFLLGSAVVWIGFAVSNMYPLNAPGVRNLRWVALAELLVFAIAYAAAAGRPLLASASTWIAGALAVSAMLSAAWSSDPRLSLGRALTFVTLLAAAGALAAGARARSHMVRPFLVALLAGAAFLAVAGLIKLAVDSNTAIVPATTTQGARYNGIGGNPDTMALLFAVAMPLAAWALFAARTAREKVGAVLVLLLLDGSLAASGSRAATVGALVGVGVVVLGMPLAARARRLLLVASAIVFLLDVGVTSLPPRAKTNPTVGVQFGQTPLFGPHDAAGLLPLSDEFGFPRPAHPRPHRSLFDAGGRLPAWKGAAKQAWQRPIAGYGFGMEDKVFVDRYYPFYSGRPENSYIGALLQLGVAGLLLLAAYFVVVARDGVRLLRRLAPGDRDPVAACLGVVAAGAVMAIAQSYLTSVGSPATAPVWICAFLLGALAPRLPRPTARA
jgi:hypothetical protein